MMNLESIKDYIASFSEKEILYTIYAYLISFIILIVFLLYRHHNTLIEMQQRAKLLNSARQDVQQILTEYNTIKSQKAEVDEKLITDKNFYLVKFYQDAMATVHISAKNSPNLISAPGPVGYTQESLQVAFTQITMQKLCEFLQILQKTPRVTVKNLEIAQSNVEKKIDVSMSLATLKPVVDKISSNK